MKKCLLMGAALLSVVSAPAIAVEVTANGGVMSEYIFRGLPQSDGKASAFAGLDITESGFYIGSWTAMVDDAFVGSDDGLEVDLYGGYSGEVGELTFGIGATAYFYTNDFDDEYKEINLNGGWRFLTLDIAIGEYDNFDGPTIDYQFYSLKAEYKGFYGLIGSFQDDFEGEYYEAGYGETLSVNEVDLFDYSMSVIHSTEDLLGDDDDTSLVLAITKNFSIYGN